MNYFVAGLKTGAPLWNLLIHDCQTQSALTGELGTLRSTRGTISTEIGITVTDSKLNNGRPTNIPTLVKGQVDVDRLVEARPPTPEQEEIAIKRAIARQKNGEALPSFNTIQEAVRVAVKRHENIDTEGEV